jgi:hypothetical protein
MQISYQLKVASLKFHLVHQSYVLRKIFNSCLDHSTEYFYFSAHFFIMIQGANVLNNYCSEILVKMKQCELQLLLIGGSLSTILLLKNYDIGKRILF